MVVIACAFASAAAAQPILWPNTKTRGAEAEVYLGRRLWLRLRAPAGAEQARAVVAATTEALMSGPRAADVRAERGEGGAWRVLVGPRSVVTVTQAEAAAQKSSAEGLAGLWAGRLKQALAGGYVAVSVKGGLDVPVGEGRLVRLAGPGLAKLSVTMTPKGVAEIRNFGARLWVAGASPGDAKLELATGDDRMALPVRVRHWAASVPPNITAAVTAPLKPNEWAEWAPAALACAVVGRPGAQARADLSGVAWPAFSARVAAEAPDCFPVRATTRVEARVAAQEIPEPRQVWVSNYPEKVACARTLLRDRIDAGPRAVRLLWHHVNVSAAPLWFGVRISNYGGERAKLAWSEMACGPGDDEVYIGHAAAAGYLDLFRRKAAMMLELAPATSVELAAIKTPPNLMASGVASLALMQGGPVVVEVVAHDAPPAGAAQALEPGAKPSERQTHLGFPGVVERPAEFKVGGPWTFIPLGRTPGNNEHGRTLHGNYGVLYWLRLALSNPSAAATDVELVAQGSAGAARACFLIAGKLVETPLLTPTRDAVACRWRLEAGQKKDVVVATMPQSGSNYPVTLILRIPPGQR
jgi:hypothetical protein